MAVGRGNDLNSGSEGTTTLYDLATGRPRQTLPESGGEVAFSRDGKLLATGACKNKIKLWNPATGELVRELTNANLIVNMNFSPDGRTLAVCTAEPDSTWFYDVATGTQRPAATGIPCCAWGAVFSPDGKTLATAVTDETVRLFDIASGKQTACLLGHSFAVGAVAWSPSGRLLASAGNDGTVRLWDITASETEDFSFAGQVKPGFFSHDGRRVAVKEPDGDLSVRELPSLRQIAAPHQIGKYIGFSPDAVALLTMRWPTNGETSELIWWRLPDFAELKKLSLPRCGGPVLPQILSPDARWLATPGAEGEVTVRDLAGNGKPPARLSVAEHGFADGLGFSPDGRELACSFPEAKAGYLWDMKTEHPPRAFPGLRGECIQFSRDGKIIFANGPTALTFWEAASGKQLGTTIGRWGGVIYLDLSPDGKTLAFPSNLGVRLWNVVTRREVGLITTPAAIASMAFAPDGKSLFITENGPQGRFTVVKRAPSFEETDAPGIP